MLEKLKNVLSELDHQSLRLEILFLEKIDLHQEDSKQETVPLKFYLPFKKLKFLEESFSSEFLKKENEDIYPGSTGSAVQYVLPFQAFLGSFQEIKPNHIVFKFVEAPFEFHCQIRDERIHMNTPDAQTMLQVACLLSRWPFLSVCSSALDPKKVQQSIAQMPYFQRKYFFNRIILGRRPSSGLLFLDKMGVLQEFIPELTAGKDLTQNRYHAYDIFEHSIRALDGVKKADLAIRWSALLHDIGKVPTRVEKENGEATFYNHEMFSARMIAPIMRRIGIPKSLGQRVRFLVRNHMFHYTKEWSDRAVKRFLRKISLKDLEDLILLRLADRKGSGKKTALPKGLEFLKAHIQKVREEEEELKVRNLEINGHDLMALGIEPGPKMGQILYALLDQVKNGQIDNEKETLKEKVSEYFL